MIFLSVIIPAYNEEKRLPETLKKVRDYLNRQEYTSEVYVVDDGSKDKTVKIVEDLIKDWKNFRILGYTPNRGKGFAVKTGMLATRGEWRLLMDADNSTDISEVEKLWKFARPSHIKDRMPEGGSSRPSEASLPTRSASSFDLATQPARVTLSDQDSHHGYDIIIGSRYLKKDSIKIKQPLGRRITSRIGNILIRVFLGLKMVDTQCGFKMFRAGIANEIFPLQTIDRWGFDMEILAIAIKKGYQIKEVPVDWYDAEGSQLKKGVAWKTLKELMIIKWNIITGKYS